jgi:hypothetical protein
LLEREFFGRVWPRLGAGPQINLHGISRRIVKGKTEEVARERGPKPGKQIAEKFPRRLA